jgi:hypothetical protein
MVKLWVFLKFRYSIPGQPLWYGSMWYPVVVLSLLVTMGDFQVSPVILVGHISHDNTKLWKLSKIGILSYEGYIRYSCRTLISHIFSTCYQIKPEILWGFKKLSKYIPWKNQVERLRRSVPVEALVWSHSFGKRRVQKFYYTFFKIGQSYIQTHKISKDLFGTEAPAIRTVSK